MIRLLGQVFAVDILRGHCGGKRKVIAALTRGQSPDALRRYREHIPQGDFLRSVGEPFGEPADALEGTADSPDNEIWDISVEDVFWRQLLPCAQSHSGRRREKHLDATLAGAIVCSGGPMSGKKDEGGYDLENYYNNKGNWGAGSYVNVTVPLEIDRGWDTASGGHLRVEPEPDFDQRAFERTDRILGSNHWWNLSPSDIQSAEELRARYYEDLGGRRRATYSREKNPDFACVTESKKDLERADVSNAGQVAREYCIAKEMHVRASIDDAARKGMRPPPAPAVPSDCEQALAEAKEQYVHTERALRNTTLRPWPLTGKDIYSQLKFMKEDWERRSTYDRAEEVCKAPLRPAVPLRWLKQ